MTTGAVRTPTAGAIPRTVWVLGFVSLLMDVSSEMVQTLLPLYLVAGLGASAVTVGAIEGFSVAVATVAKLVAGQLSDRLGERKRLAAIGYGLGALSKPIIPLAESLGWIVAAKGLDRIGKGVRGAPRDALIADVTPPEIRGASFGLRKSLDTVGGFVGPALAVVLMLATGDSFTTVFWIAVVPAFLAVGLLLVGVREPARPATATPKPAPHVRDAFKLNRAVWAVIAVSAVLTAARFSEAFLLLRAQQAGFALAWVPATMVIMHLVYGLAAYPAGVLSDRIGSVGPLAASLVALIAADLALAAADGVGLFLAGVVLWGLHMGLSQGLLATLIGDAAPAHLRGTAFGVFSLVTGLTVLASDVAAGLLWAGYGPAATFLMGAVFSALALLTLPALPRGRPPRDRA